MDAKAAYVRLAGGGGADARLRAAPVLIEPVGGRGAWTLLVGCPDGAVRLLLGCSPFRPLWPASEPVLDGGACDAMPAAHAYGGVATRPVG